MKAFIFGALAAIILAVVAAVILQNANLTVDTAFTASSARISHTN